MELFSTYTIKTEGFQEVSYGITHLLRTVPLDKKCRVILEYDPNNINAEVKTSTYEDGKMDLSKEYSEEVKGIDGYLSKMSEVNEKEKPLDGECEHLLRFGSFPKHLMEKFGLIRYAGKHGKTRIVIEYNNDTGNGWMRAVSECPENIPIRTDQQGLLK